jgi:hypothetical protein
MGRMIRLATLGAPLGGGGGPLILDTFTDADTTLLQNHTMEVGPGWTKVGADCTIVSNMITGPSGGAYITNAGVTTYTISATVTLSTTSGHRVGVYWGANSNRTQYYGFSIGKDVSGTDWYLQKDGSTIATGEANRPPGNYTLLVAVDTGGNVAIYMGETLVYQFAMDAYTDNTYIGLFFVGGDTCSILDYRADPL